MIIVECNNVIKYEYKDALLDEKLLAEKEGIINKCIQVLKKAIDRGYKVTESTGCFAEHKQYSLENNLVQIFYNKRSETRKDGEIIKYSCSTKKIYDIFRDFCK